MVTFRMIKNTVNKVWNVWQIVDEAGNKQAGLRLNGDQQSLEYFLIDADGNLQTVTFPGLSVLFNTRWHKVMVGVERNQVTLYVDCQPVDMKPIKGKGPINTEGDTLIGRLDTDPDASVVVREAGRASITSSDPPCTLCQQRCAFSHVWVYTCAELGWNSERLLSQQSCSAGFSVKRGARTTRSRTGRELRRGLIDAKR